MQSEQDNGENIYYKFKDHQSDSSMDIDWDRIPSKMINREAFFTIDENLSFTEQVIKEEMGLVKNKFVIFQGKINIGIAYIKGVADEALLHNQILKPLLRSDVDVSIPPKKIVELIKSQYISVVNIKTTSHMNEIIESILKGYIILFLNYTNEVIIINAIKMEKRGIEKPENEVTLYASKDSFTEDLDTNCSLILRRLPTPDIHFETFNIGKYSKTAVKLIWIEGIAKPGIIENVYKRLGKINIDSFSSVDSLAELIQDHPMSIFPIFRETERPDVASKYLTRGHFILLCSNSPHAIIAPVSLWDNFKTMDDYTETSPIGTYIRIIRIAAFLISIIASPLYISFVTYNHAIVPPTLAANLLAGRQGVPFPSIIELLLMTFMIGIIREAGARMPGMVGFFIGIFGAIIIGQASVTAGYVSASLIIVVAVSSIASFAISSSKMVNTSKLINYFLIILAGFFGMFGLLNGIILILWYLVSIDSFGVSYLYPVVPFESEGNKDLLLRFPLNALKKRLKWLSFNITKNNSDK